MRSFFLTGIAMLLSASGPAVARTLDRPAYMVPANKVIGLYDSSDAGAGARDRIPLVREALARLGLTFITHDVAGGLPSLDAQKDCRAIVTLFTDGRMVGVDHYIGWLEGQMDRGLKVVILGDFGAFQDVDTKVWTDPSHVNRIYRRLGAIYGGNALVGPALRLSAEPDRSIVGGADPGLAGHYALVRAVRADVRSHLVVERVDQPDSASAVVFTSRDGGAVLNHYVDDPSGKPWLQLERFLDLAVIGETAGSTRLLIVVESDGAAARRMENNLSWVLRYSRLQADFVRMKDLPAVSRRDLERYGALVVATEGMDELGRETAKRVESWVKGGGGLVVLAPNGRPDWNAMLGVTGVSHSLETVIGVRYVGKVFPGLDGMVVADIDEGTHAPQPIGQIVPSTLTADTTVLAVSVDPLAAGTPPNAAGPILWTRRHGTGRVVFGSEFIFREKENRGQLLQLLLRALPFAAVPIVNAKVLFLDDCPMPMWDVAKEPVKSEYGMTDTRFYMDVWWPDMLAAAKEFDLRYTLALVFNYSASRPENFGSDPLLVETGFGAPVKIAREAVAFGHEVGLHGYNHQSLVSEAGVTSTGWPTRETMMTGLVRARREWARLFGPGNMPFTYIAPNNHIHRAGKEAVAKVFPEVHVMSAALLDDDDREGAEWDQDPDVSQFMDLPRASSEFYLDAHNNVGFHDSVMLTGMWVHFAHPDDVYDPDRNGGMGWKGLRESNRKMLTHLRDAYPWLRSMTARDSFHELVSYRSEPFDVTITPGNATIRLAAGSERTRWFQLRVDPGTAVEGTDTATLRHADPDYGLYVFEGKGPKAVVRLGATPALVR